MMTYHEAWLREFPYWTFADAIGAASDDFPREWKRFWGIGASVCPDHLDADEWEVANEMHDVARRICAVATRLLDQGLPHQLRTLPGLLEIEATSEKKSRREFVAALEERLTAEQRRSPMLQDVLYFLKWREGEAEAKAKLFRSAIEIYAYPEFGCSPGQVASRLLDLLEFLVRTRGERAREYLCRVATCYVRDMLPEMAVMSRAVMEAGLQLPAVEERLDANLKVKSKRRPGLGDWIEAAYEVEVLDDEGRRRADAIKTAGDNAIHKVPKQTPDPRSILESLRIVLTQVERFERG